jgi:hypothetical protein
LHEFGLHVTTTLDAQSFFDAKQVTHPGKLLQDVKDLSYKGPNWLLSCGGFYLRDRRRLDYLKLNRGIHRAKGRLSFLR